MADSRPDSRLWAEGPEGGAQVLAPTAPATAEVSEPADAYGWGV